MIPRTDGAAPAPTPRELRELAYAQRIAVYGVKKFVPDLKTWQPLDTMMGVLSQIDNLLAGTPAPQESPRPTTGATADYPQAAFARGVRHGLSTGAQTTEYGVLNVIREGWKQDCELRAIPAAPQEESRGSE